jgi:hypothetical protein
MIRRNDPVGRKVTLIAARSWTFGPLFFGLGLSRADDGALCETRQVQLFLWGGHAIIVQWVTYAG